MAYTSVADVKAYLGINEATDDALISDLITSVDAAINAHTGRIFEASADTTRYFDMRRGVVDGLSLNVGADLYSVTTITNGDGVEVTSDEYILRPTNDGPPYHRVQLKSSSNKNWEAATDGSTENAISIAGRWAYSTTPPALIAEAAKRWVAAKYKEKDTPEGIVTALQTGVQIEPGEMPADVRAALHPFIKAVL